MRAMEFSNRDGGHTDVAGGLSGASSAFAARKRSAQRKHSDRSENRYQRHHRQAIAGFNPKGKGYRGEKNWKQCDMAQPDKSGSLRDQAKQRKKEDQDIAQNKSDPDHRLAGSALSKHRGKGETFVTKQITAAVYE